MAGPDQDVYGLDINMEEMQFDEDEEGGEESENWRDDY